MDKDESEGSDLGAVQGLGGRKKPKKGKEKKKKKGQKNKNKKKEKS